MPEVEQHELGGALDQWRDAVKSVAAAAALQVGVAEQHLLAAVGRWVGAATLLVTCSRDIMSAGRQGRSLSHCSRS